MGSAFFWSGILHGLGVNSYANYIGGAVLQRFAVACPVVVSGIQARRAVKSQVCCASACFTGSHAGPIHLFCPDPGPPGPNVMLTFQQIILKLQSYWDAQGCALLQPYDMEVGAGTSHTATFLRALGPEPWKAAYVQPSRRPKDGR